MSTSPLNATMRRFKISAFVLVLHYINFSNLFNIFRKIMQLFFPPIERELPEKVTLKLLFFHQNSPKSNLSWIIHSCAVNNSGLIFFMLSIITFFVILYLLWFSYILIPSEYFVIRIQFSIPSLTCSSSWIFRISIGVQTIWLRSTFVGVFVPYTFTV